MNQNKQCKCEKPCKKQNAGVVSNLVDDTLDIATSSVEIAGDVISSVCCTVGDAVGGVADAISSIDV